jgi:fatty acid desaturase
LILRRLEAQSETKPKFHASHYRQLAWAVAIHSVLPRMLIGLPSFYGAWLLVIFGLIQHAGLAEDVLDHRLNCRTVYMNPVFRFVYWNMSSARHPT